jgi:hypothetical protein
MPKGPSERSIAISMLDWRAKGAVASCRLFGQRFDPCAEIPGRERRLSRRAAVNARFRSAGRSSAGPKPWASRSPTAAIAPIGRPRTRQQCAGQFSERPFQGDRNKALSGGLLPDPAGPKALLEPRLGLNPTLVGHRGGICGAVLLAACPRTVRIEPRQ